MNYLFENISNKNKEKLLKSLEANSFIFKKNMNILSTVKKENIIIMIEYGCVQIVRNDYNGNRTIIEKLVENDIFGSKIAPISNENYDIITKEETKIIIIDYDRITNGETMKQEFYTQFIKNLLTIITNKINERNEQIEILTKKTIRDKLLEYFKIMSKKSGTRIIYLPFNFTELADYLATDRSAMSRELKNLKEEGFIKIVNKKITLLY